MRFRDGKYLYMYFIFSTAGLVYRLLQFDCYQKKKYGSWKYKRKLIQINKIEYNFYFI